MIQPRRQPLELASVGVVFWLILAVVVAAGEVRSQQRGSLASEGGVGAEENAAPSAVRGSPEVDEITVVGTVSDATDVQDEAQAVTAFSMEALDRANVVNVESLAFNVPGLHVGRQGNQVIVTLRGIGTENAAVTGEPGVAYHVDGVNYARPAAAQVAFFDLEGVQVQRGPQGVRGGRNTTAGAIQVVTRKPHGAYQMSADVQFGSFDQRRVRTALNLPLSETLQTRSALLIESRNGYLENQFLNDEDRDTFDVDDLGFRQHLRLMPTENIETLLTYNYYRQDGNGAQLQLIPGPAQENTCADGVRSNNGLPVQLNCLPVRRVRLNENGVEVPVDTGFGFGTEFLHASNAVAHDPTRILADTPASRDNRFWGFTSTTTWDVPSLGFLEETRLQGIGAFQRTRTSLLQDFDGSELPANDLLLNEDTYQTSAELQWSSTAGERIDWQASAFYLRESSSADVVLNILQKRVETPGGELRPGFDPFQAEQSVVNKSYGLALAADVYLAESWTLSAGARYSKDVRGVSVLRETTGFSQIPGLRLQHCSGGAQDTESNFVPDTGLAVPSFPVRDAQGNLFQPIPVPSCSDTFRHLTGGLGLEWRPFDEQLLYARVDRGYKAGGFANLGFGTYEPEFIWAYSLGAKTRFFDGLLTLNSELFYNDYSDLQLVLIDGISFRTDNANARVWGFDLEMVAEPTAGLRLNGQLSYLNTELRDYSSIDPTDEDKTIAQALCELEPGNFTCPTPVDFSGNELSRAPEWSVTLGAEYSFVLDRWGVITPRVQYYWQDDTFYRGFNAPLDLQQTYHQTDVKLSWTSPEEIWEVQAFVTNLEDDSVFQNVLVGPNVLDSPQNAWFGPPRMWGVRVGYRYE